jgi:broad specificity phosphatase PhoE/GNAT superfamily N-acetyltransferase
MAVPDGRITVDDPRAPDVRGLLARHLAFAHQHSPPEDVHALDVDGLAGPDVEFFSFRRDDELLAVGALKRIDDDHAELKSMHTAEGARRTGIGRAMVDHLLGVARRKAYRRVSLETGSMEAFVPARALYASVGFEACGPFGDYVESVNSSFMTLGFPTSVVFETHALTEDNADGIATGWLDGRLSAVGRRGALDLGRRRRDDGLAAVFSSDLRRVRETVQIAFAGSPVPVLYDWRLRECDYGSWNGAPAATVIGSRAAHVDEPYPGGESCRGAVERVRGWLGDLSPRWDGRRVLVVGHQATLWGLAHWIDGTALEELAGREFEWREGWEFQVPTTTAP